MRRFGLGQGRVRRHRWRGRWPNSSASRSILSVAGMWKHRGSCGNGMGNTDNTDNKLIFAADLGGTHLRAATVDQSGKIQFRFKQNTPQGSDPLAIVDAVVAAVNECR